MRVAADGRKRVDRNPMAKSKPNINGSTELIEVVPLADLLADPSNLRRHPERNRQAIAASVRRFGAARSVVMDGKGIIRAGNATLEAAQAEGIKSARIVEATGDELIVVRRRDWSDTEATAYGIADNRLSDLSTFDDRSLAETLRALQSEDFDLNAVGYLDSEVDELVARLGSEGLAGEAVEDPAGEWQGMPEFEHEDLTGDAAFTIRVFLKDEEDLAAFGRLLGKDLTGRKFVWFSKQPLGETYEAVDG